jgi:serine protease Do
VVGINTLIITDGISRANAGVGFSVPINVAKGILPQLRSKGRVDRGWMGVVIGNVSEALAKTYGLSEAKGALVNSVNPGSPAEKAGIKPEEVVLAVDGRPVADSGDLARYISSRAPGTVVKLEVLSVKGERRSVSVTLGTFQDDTQERAERERDTARLGMTLRDLTGPMAERLDLPPSARGVMVMSVETGEAAEEAGIVRGDVIVSVNGTPVADTDAFERAIDEARPNGAARLRVLNRRLGDRVVVLELK